MMPRQPIEITLGEKICTIRPMKIDQICKIEEAITAQGVSGTSMAINVLTAALERDYPDVAANLREIEAPVGEVRAAFQACLHHAGFITDVPAAQAVEG